MNIWYVLFWIQLIFWAVLFLAFWQLWKRHDYSIREIKEYLNARDEIPFFEGVFEDEKSNFHDLSSVIDRMRDAFPGKGSGGDRSCGC